ncbi:sugar ABC transporter permease [Paenibacillus sp. CF384]|uniref:ABC transporter permease n=1 Tax=Paenibacillus sp. CF384 TaxID=1884382 RepID=UPI00089CC6A3|nr:ABC transporter permease subunit [Paenibacillus sp. CF384]SDW20460.1 multiple sugar transport system permease protein/putative aldouronate transport system permease protein [Paenibacillus sp. CF384]
MKFKASRVTLFIMVVPFILLVFAFNYIPLFGWVYAFYDYKPGIPLSQTPFVGLKFFRWAIEEKEDLFRVLTNTLALSFLSILASPLSVIFAIMLNELRSKRFRKIVQTLTTLPNFISWIIVYSLAFFMFSSGGLLNEILMKLHWIDEPTTLLGNSAATWWFQTGITIWKSLGWGAIIYLAAIAGIDPELYDAAKVDGAGRFQRIMAITVPGIMPTFFVLLLLNIASVLSNGASGFEQNFVFYNSLVADRIEALDYYVYRVGITTGDISFGTAIGIAKSIISILLLFSMNALSKKVRGHSVF